MLYKVAGVDVRNPARKQEALIDAEDESAARVKAADMGIDLTGSGSSVTALPPTSGLPTLAVPGGGVERGLLTCGQVVSVLGCLASPFFALFTLMTDRSGRGFPVVLGAVVAFLYSAAMFVVFSRVKGLPDR
jgi:hypothetical protein